MISPLTEEALSGEIYVQQIKSSWTIPCRVGAVLYRQRRDSYAALPVAKSDSNQVFEEILSEQHAAQITGVLFVLKESVIHLVETSMDTSISFLRRIDNMETQLDPSERVIENVCSVNAYGSC